MPDRTWWRNEWDRSEYDRQRYQTWKTRLVELLGGKCIRCGTTENLQFDHVERKEKLFVITQRVWNDPGKLQEELAKCQLLCEEHHKEKTKEELSQPRNDHGGGKWGIAKCKCDLCRERRNRYVRERRAERAAARQDQISKI